MVIFVSLWSFNLSIWLFFCHFVAILFIFVFTCVFYGDFWSLYSHFVCSWSFFSSCSLCPPLWPCLCLSSHLRPLVNFCFSLRSFCVSLWSAVFVQAFSSPTLSLSLSLWSFWLYSYSFSIFFLSFIHCYSAIVLDLFALISFSSTLDNTSHKGSVHICRHLILLVIVTLLNLP